MKMRWRCLAGLILPLALSGCGSDEVAHTTPSTGGTAGTAGEGGAGGSGGTAGAGGTAGGDTGGTAGTGGSGGCVTLTPEDTAIYFGSFGAFALQARVDHPLAGYAKTRLALELYDEGSGLPPGTFDLSQSPDDNYGTCEHCVLLVAYDEVNRPRRVFFQKSGSMKLDKLDFFEGTGAGSVDSVQLVEVRQNADLSWSEVPGGGCFDLPAWSFDTTPVDGGECDSAEDCPNVAWQVCDVETHKCVAYECSLTFDPPFCNEGQRCMSQIGALIERDEGGSAAGACYTECTQNASGACAEGEVCFPLGPVQETGVCIPTGTAKVGEACTPADVSTGCEAGAFCAGDPPRCQKACNYLTSNGDCPSGTYCSQINLCEPLAVGDLAPVGTQCDAASPDLRDCGPEGDMFRGLCINWFPEEQNKICERLCKLNDPVCDPNQDCLPLFSNPSIGVCHTRPTCGDKQLDLIGGEQCDDGNTQSGDGCSGDCRSTEPGALCNKAEPLSMGINFDSNEGGPTGYASLCDPYVANPAKLYSFMPATPGKLVLELDSAADLGISVLADCADANSELECTNLPGSDYLELNFEAVPTKPLLVTVRGAYPGAKGLFVLAASFIPEDCGDGQVSGSEVCDDKNQTDNDGCSADCSTIQWSPLCAALPALTLNTPVSGNLDGGTHYFDTSGFCAYQSGAERAYTFTPTASGTLHLGLTSEGNLDLITLSTCGPVDPDLLRCSNSGWAGQSEQLDVDVTAGAPITIVVQGHAKTEGGPFELIASM
ncbi:MAG: DUF4215 domain-containing protein [Polyangiaceae bacterium]